jgi:ribonuclease P protein component
VVEPAFVLLIAPRPRDDASERQRLGITVSRKVGSAVVRNRVKRQVREWFRVERRRLRPAIDLVVIGRSAAARLSAEEARGTLCRLARKADAMKPCASP